MKKLKKGIYILVILIMSLFLLTGCATLNYDITLNNDGSADVSYTFGYDKKIIESMGAEVSDLDTSSMKEEVLKEGYNIEDFSDDNLVGFKATKHMNSVSDISLSELFGEEYIKNSKDSKIVYKKELLKTEFSQNAVIDATALLADESEENAQITNALMKSMTMKYTINLPTKATESNATTVTNDGKTLEWNLTPGSVVEINFKAVQDYTMFAVIGVIAVIVIIGIIVLVVVKSKNKKVVEEKVVESEKNETEVKTENEDADEQNSNKKEEIEENQDKEDNKE